MTRLRRGGAVTRVVPSAHHDCRKSGELVVTITGTGAGAVLTFKPLRSRKAEYSIPVDAVLSIAIKRQVWGV